MPVGRKYTPYRKVLEKLKIKQLDVYRYPDHDELRLMTPEGKIVVVKLSKRREEYTPEEFEKEVLSLLRARRS